MKGYFDRGYLPHFDVTHLFQHVCLHLSDSVPLRLLERLKLDLEKIPESKRSKARSMRIAAWMDRGYGCCALKVHWIADEVEKLLISNHGTKYVLQAWVVMPNHIHCLVKTCEGYDLPTIVGSWKRESGKLINDYLRSHGKPILSPVFHREYFDRYIRDEKHFQNVVAYIHRNPVKAGLTYRSENWKWSSASKERNQIPPELRD